MSDFEVSSRRTLGTSLAVALPRYGRGRRGSAATAREPGGNPKFRTFLLEVVPSSASNSFGLSSCIHFSCHSAGGWDHPRCSVGLGNASRHGFKLLDSNRLKHAASLSLWMVIFEAALASTLRVTHIPHSFFFLNQALRDEVPAGCCVELGMHLQAPQYLATCAA